MGRVKLVVGAIVAMAAASGATWVTAAQMMRTPAQVAAEAEAPEPGPVTAPVERRTLTNEVVTRGTVVYDEPVGIELTATPDRDLKAVVTRVPDPGDTVEEGDVAVEVAGRPILVLQGELPAYRDLRPGASGDDVAQLQAGLKRLGYDVGEVDGLFGPATEAAVQAWYADAGYEPREPVEQKQEALDRAEDERDGAADALERARANLREARQGPGDVSAAEQAVADARAELDEAAAELQALRAETGTWVPVGEVEFVDELPRRVDTVEVELGDEASGELVTLTEGEVVVEADLDAEEATFVEEGTTVDLVPDDEDALAGTVTEVDEEGDGARLTVAAEDEEAAEQLIDASVRVDIPVEGTDGEVLAVPLPAVSVAGDGASRVEVLRKPAGGAGDDAGEPVTEFVPVEPGMSADGFAEVEPLEGELAEGDQVVVGRGPDEASADPAGNEDADA